MVKFKIIVLIIFVNTTSIAQSNFKIFPNMTSIFNNMVIDSQVMSFNSNNGLNSIYIHVSCYGRNLRKISNPLNPYNNLTAHITLNVNNEIIPVKVNFPAILTTSSFGYLSTHSTWKNNIGVVPGAAPPGTRVGGTHRTVRIDIPSLGRAELNSLGEISIEKKTAYFRSISFTQGKPTAAPAESTTDRDLTLLAPTYGAVYGAVTTSVSADQKSVNVYASFPGAGGYCGGYYSPLMLFFDEKMPNFTGQSNFKLNDEALSIYWPEAHSPGYFLALDRNNNGHIDDGKELFGDQIHEDGFQALSVLDTNQDGQISKKDKLFRRLILWQDKNGDGVSQKSELKSLKAMGVIAINLNYNKIARSFGDRALYDKKSIFKFRSKGQKNEGIVVDMYFQSRPQSLAVKN